MNKLFFVLLSIIFLSAVARAESPGNVPDVLYMNDLDHPQPDWVAASKVLTPSGDVDSQLFSPSDQAFIKKLLSRPSERGCIRLGILEETERLGTPRRPDLKRAAQNSDWVFVAKVTVRKAGFHRNIPGILLQIHPEETIKGPADRSSAHFIFMPIGVFEIGTTGICKTHPSYANLPEIGDEVLLFIDLESTWREQGEFLWTDEETGIVTIHGSKEVSFPRNFLTNGKSTKPATREELLRRVQEELRGSR